MLSVLGGVFKNGSGNTLLWSNDGLNWTVSPDSKSLFTTACGKIAFNGTMWIAGAGHGENANVVAYSSDRVHCRATCSSRKLASTNYIGKSGITNCSIPNYRF